MNKYAVFATIVLVSVFLDLWTKNIAENNLASVTSRWDHPLEREVVDADDGMTLNDWIDREFGEGTSATSPPELQGIYRSEDGVRQEPLGGQSMVATGQTVQINYREVVIVEGFWSHVYVQNFGAAWGFLSQQNEKFVRPFFLIVSLIAVFVVLRIFRNVRSDQKVLMFALSFIVGGAIGNFVDRARYGYVVDFVDWYLTWGGEEHHWPTFNVADVWISVGVGLMIIEILFNGDPTAPAANEDEEGEEALAEAAA